MRVSVQEVLLPPDKAVLVYLPTPPTLSQPGLICVTALLRQTEKAHERQITRTRAVGWQSTTSHDQTVHPRAHKLGVAQWLCTSESA